MTIVLTSYIINVDPKISVIPEFLSKFECEHLIAISEQIGFSPSLVGRGQNIYLSETFSNQISPSRTSLSVTIGPHHNDQVLAGIEEKLASLVHMDVSHLESLVVVKYEPGQQFKVHHDGRFRPFTVFLYLNEAAEGGETRFPELALRIKPSMGTAVMWGNDDSRVEHEGLPPVGWTKYGVNCFFNAVKMR